MNKYPMIVKEKGGDGEVTIRQIMNRGRAVFRLEYDLDGVRRLKLRADESDAQRDAKGFLALLNNRAPVFAETEDSTVFHSAKTILAGIAPVDIAAREFANAYRRLGGNLLAEAVDFFLKHKPANSTTKIPEIVKLFLAEIEADVCYDNFKRLRSRLRRFVRRFTGLLHEVTAIELKAWIKGFNLGERARNNERATLVQFFRWARDNGYLPVGVPVAPELIKKLDAQTTVTIFTVPVVTKLLTALEKEKPELVAYAALGFFGGVRPAEMSRLRFEKAIRWNFGDIEITAEDSKTGTRRLTKMEDNLKAWLAPFRDEVGDIAPIDAAGKLAAFAKKKGFGWPRDVMRHSFISYMVAKIQQIGQVALWAGNSEYVIKKHYLERVTEEEGIAFFSIMPDSAGNVIDMKGRKVRAKAA